MKCNCNLWLDNIGKINGVIAFQYAHGIEYSGDAFNFCPWCGRILAPDDL